MNELFSINHTLFEFLGYNMNLLELLAALTGLAAVWLAARGNIITWPFAMVNAVLFFILFYQVNLYSGMMLQLFYFSNAIYGWVNWKKDSSGEKKPVTLLKHKQRVLWLAAVFAATVLLAFFMKRIHLIFPDYFPVKATFVYTDAIITVLSIAASVLLARLKLENWILWILIDVVCVAMYAMRGVMLVSIQYAIFFIMASYGFIEWKRKLKTEDSGFRSRD